MKIISRSENRIKTKLSSQAGASITFALLLFLVCAALSAVVLVASTTAAGRLANTAETDQRYYAVSSAAALLRDSLDGVSVSVVKMKDGGTKVFNKPMNEITNADIGLSPDEISLDDGEDAPAGSSGGETTLNPIAAAFANIISGGDEPAASSKMSLSSSVTGDPLNVTIEQTRNAAGDMTLMLYNTKGQPYRMQLVFGTEIKRASPPVTKFDGMEVSDNGSYEIEWHLTRTVSAYDAQ